MNALLTVLVAGIVSYVTSKMLEHNKAQLENKNYVSKVRFDAEFAIYKEISEAMFVLTNNISYLWNHSALMDATQRENDISKFDMYKEIAKAMHEPACQYYHAANNAICKNSPFIPKEFYTSFIELKNLCFKAIKGFELFTLNSNADNARELLSNEYTEYKNIMTPIKEKQDKIMNELGEHLEKLKTYNN